MPRSLNIRKPSFFSSLSSQPIELTNIWARKLHELTNVFLAWQYQDPGKATEAPPSQKFRRELQEVAPCASRLYEAVARPGQLSRQVEEWLG